MGKLLKISPHKLPKVLSVLILVGLTSISVLVFAATRPHIKFEAESGTRSATANLVTDNAASGGSAVRFDSASTPSPSGDIAATRATVGPRVALSDRAGGNIPCGTYNAVRFTSKVEFVNHCTYIFNDVEMCVGGGFGSATRVVEVNYANITCGIYYESGGHGGWTINRSYVTDTCVGLRPQGATNGRVMTVNDTVVYVSGSTSPDAHCEAMASFTNSGGLSSNVHVNRSRFIVQSRWSGDATVNTGITNITGTDYVFTDTVFGDPSEPQPAYFMIYQSGATFIRPRFYPGRAGVFYSGPPSGSQLVDPTYL